MVLEGKSVAAALSPRVKPLHEHNPHAQDCAWLRMEIGICPLVVMAAL